MRAILLIATNFARTQWLPVAIMTAYLAGIGGVFGWHEQHPDVRFFLQWHSYNVLFVVTMIAIPAIWSERRSRRILAVLSKGIDRWQYLGGILCGCAMIAGIFCLMVGLAAVLGGARTNSPVTGLVPLLLMVFAASVCVASIGIFCSTFLHPMFATGLASVLVAVPSLGMMRGWNLSPVVFTVGEGVRTESVVKFLQPH